MQISGTGNWLLEGWIGDHAVDVLVDSGSAVTAMSRSFFNSLSEAGAPVGVLRSTTRRLRGANGSHIDISGCSTCVVSFLGLRTEFPVLVFDLSTDAIIGTNTLGSILPHTGYQEWIAVHGGRSFASTTSERCCIVRTRFYGGALFHSTTL